MPTTKKTLRKRRTEIKRRSEQSRRNKRQALQEYLLRPSLENVLGITAAVGYTNVIPVAKKVSKRAATNNLIRNTTMKLKRKNANGNTRLHLATTDDEVKRLVAIGLDINEQNKNGETPLLVRIKSQMMTPYSYEDHLDNQQQALLDSFVETIDLYIELGADLTIEDENGIPLYMFLWIPNYYIATNLVATNKTFQTLVENNLYEIRKYVASETRKLRDLPGRENEILSLEGAREMLNFYIEQKYGPNNINNNNNNNNVNAAINNFLAAQEEFENL